jgi:hypothetical protein
VNIDLNDDHQVTIENVARLLASVNDDRKWQLTVSRSGIAYLSDQVAPSIDEGIAFRLEPWDEGDECVGPSAARDQSWVTFLWRLLLHNWPEPKAPYIEIL